MAQGTEQSKSMDLPLLSNENQIAEQYNITTMTNLITDYSADQICLNHIESKPIEKQIADNTLITIADGKKNKDQIENKSEVKLKNESTGGIDTKQMNTNSSMVTIKGLLKKKLQQKKSKDRNRKPEFVLDGTAMKT